MRRVTGLDLNGWCDEAARDWSPEDPDTVLAPPAILDGGLESMAVRENSGKWTGGPQAALAPHGRGGGWGDIGHRDRRIALADELTRLLGGECVSGLEALPAAADAMAYGAEDAIVAVADRPELNEAAQQIILKCLSESRRRHRLLWRPVALFLDALFSSRTIRPEFEGENFRLLLHAGDGIEVQTLRLRADKEHRDHYAPERENYGRVVLSDLGLTSLRARAEAAVIASNPSLGTGSVEQSRLPMAFLCGAAEAGETEVLRRDNGTWLEAQAPMLHPEDIFHDIDCRQEDSDPGQVVATLLVTPLKGLFANRFLEIISEKWPEITPMPWEGVARGSLIAGRLIERGLPHYFDRLEPIALAVMAEDEPEFADLIDEDDTVPANREYVSPPYRGLSWGRGKTEIEFYILKGGKEVRHWTVHRDEGPTEAVGVELRLRQTPGQSWAKLSVTSPEWEPLNRSPIFLDWAALTPSELTPEEVLEVLRIPPPPIPKLIFERADLEFWKGGGWFRDGLLDVLDRSELRPAASAKALLGHLRRQLRDPVTGDRVRPIGTDGSLPQEFSEDERLRFLRFLDRLSRTVATFSLRHPPSNNDAIACLTWAFTLCPEPTQEAIVAALEAHLLGRMHPLLFPNSSIRVLTQGAGRAITGPERMRRVLNVLAKRRVNNDTINALAMILTRRENATTALKPELVDKFFEDLAEALLRQVQVLSFKTLFRNTLSALAGMFRWREVEPYALLAARDPTAARVRDTLERADGELARQSARVPQVAEKRNKIAAIIEYLDGGGDPNILYQIERDDEEQEDEDPEA